MIKQKFRTIAKFINCGLLITDATYYVENEKEITDWMNNSVPGWKIQGMVLEFKSEQDLVAFLLRWS